MAVSTLAANGPLIPLVLPVSKEKWKGHEDEQRLVRRARKADVEHGEVRQRVARTRSPGRGASIVELAWAEGATHGSSAATSQRFIRALRSPGGCSGGEAD